MDLFLVTGIYEWVQKGTVEPSQRYALYCAILVIIKNPICVDLLCNLI